MSCWLEWGVFSSMWELEELIKPQEGLSPRGGKIPNTNPSTNNSMAHAGSTRQEGRGVEKMTSDSGKGWAKGKGWAWGWGRSAPEEHAP